MTLWVLGEAQKQTLNIYNNKYHLIKHLTETTSVTQVGVFGEIVCLTFLDAMFRTISGINDLDNESIILSNRLNRICLLL